MGAGPFTSGDVTVTDAEGPDVRCGDVITEDTTLTSDMNCYAQDPSGVALTIGAPGITLDLGGHTLNVYEGVVNEGHDDVTIRNGTFQAEWGAVRLSGVTGNTVRDIGAKGFLPGIRLENSDGNRILSNDLSSVTLNLVEGSDHNLVRDNVLTAKEGVMGLSESSDNRILDNVVWTYDTSAIGLYRAHRNRIRGNTFVMEYDAAMRLGSSDDNDVFDNRFVQHGTYRDAGVRMADSDRNVFRSNEFTGGPVGIFISSGADNVFRLNTLSGAPRSEWPNREADGITVEAAATGTLLQGNSVEDFEDDGIEVTAPGARLRRNTSNDNGDLGIEAVPGVTDLGGNSASGNGNPLQCVNVFCG